MPRPAGPQRLAALALAAIAGLASCASERHLVVLSDPPGATVRLDNELVGLTPLRYRFEHFGDRRLTLYLEGFQPEVRAVAIDAPWYATFPVDLFTELLFPVGYRFVQVERFELSPETGRVTQPDLEGALRRAERLRRGGLTGPRPDPEPEAAPGPAPQPDAPKPAPADAPPAAGADGRERTP